VAEIKQRQRDVWTAFAAGVIVTALFVLLIVLLLRPG
jgi:fumarate reductase subunit D